MQQLLEKVDKMYDIMQDLRRDPSVKSGTKRKRSSTLAGGADDDSSPRLAKSPATSHTPHDEADEYSDDNMPQSAMSEMGAPPFEQPHPPAPQYEQPHFATPQYEQRSSATTQHDHVSGFHGLQTPQGSGPTGLTPMNEDIKKSEEDSLGGIPANHKTSVEHLRTWPAIKQFYEDSGHGQADTITQFERKQGFLRTFGVGYTGDGLETERNDCTSGSSAQSPASDADLDSLDPDSLWGNFQIEGNLKLDEQTVIRLHDVYFKKFHILQPFLDQSRVKALMQRFLKNHRSQQQPDKTNSPQAERITSSPSGMMVPPYTRPGDTPGAQKRRVPQGVERGPGSSDYGPQFAPPVKPIDRSLQTAIILLILALGRMGEHTEALLAIPQPNRVSAPASAQWSNSSPRSAPSPASSKPSPISSHSTMVSNTHSPNTAELRPDPKKNMDAFPGLAYFAMGTDILHFYSRTEMVAAREDCQPEQAAKDKKAKPPNHDSSVSNLLHQVWAFLLAALYMGQLARTYESFTYIDTAAKTWIRLKGQ